MAQAEAGLAKMLGSAVGQIAAKLLGGIVEPMLEAGGAAARLWVFDRLGWTPGIIRDTLSVIENGGPDVATGMSADGIIETLHGELWSVVKTMFVHPELADEFVMEMISEGVSNAMQYNIGGAIQSILNIWRGSYPIEPDSISDLVGQNLDVIDSALAFFLSATAGANLPATAALLGTSINNMMKQNYSAVEARMFEHISRLEALTLFFHTAAEEIASRILVEAIEEPVSKAEYIVNMLRYAYERAVARLQEYLAELMVLKMYKDSGVIKPEAADQLGLLTYAEAMSLVEGLNEVESTLLQALEAISTIDLQPVIDELVALLAEAAKVYIGMATAAANATQDDLDQLHQKMVEALTLLTMVRTYKEGSYSTEPPVEAILQDAQAEEIEPTAETVSGQTQTQESG